MSDQPPEVQGIRVGLVSCYPPSTGPLSEYAYHLAKEYARDPRISKVTVMCDRVRDEREKSKDKIEADSCWNLNDPLAVFTLVKRCLETRPNIIHFNILFRQFSSHRIVNFLGLAGPAIFRLLRIPVVVTLHSMAEGLDVKEAGYSDSFINRVGYTIATRLLLRADVVTVPHKHFVNILTRRYRAHNVLLVPHGVFFQPIQKLKFSGKRLLLFGKIGPYKNPSLAIQAFNRVFLKDREVELLIAGPAHPFHRGFLNSTIQSKELMGVRFTGYVAENQLEDLFTSCTAVLLPYTTPTWSSGTFTLASAFGRPVIASDVPDFRELASEGAGIVLFPNGDREALAKNIEEIVNNRAMQQRLGEANLEWARAHSFADVAHTLVDLLYSIARQNAAQTG